jgi:hypothetical protein
MSKTSNRQRVETLKIWIADRKIKPKKKKQPDWLKSILGEDED